MAEESISELEERAATHRRNEKWREARLCYEKMIRLGLPPLDEAKMLANIMQMYEKEGDTEAAINAGMQALELIQNYRLYETMEGVHLRGFLNGSLRRLRGQPFDWLPMATILLANALGAVLGAWIGSGIEYEGLTIHGPAWTDLRYGGAGIGGILGWLLLLRPLSHMTPYFGVPLTALAACLNVLALCYLLMQKDPLLGLLVTPIALAPSAIVFAAGFLRRKK